MPERVRPWLYRAASNAAISRSRRRTSLTRLLPRLLERAEPARPEGETLRVERDAELHLALATLEPDGRAALLLAAQGFDGREIAASIGRTEAATRTLMCRSRIKLRLLLEAAEGQS
jgi:RNA polymerase sigma factor (sigma-70 family)